MEADAFQVYWPAAWPEAQAQKIGHEIEVGEQVYVQRIAGLPVRRRLQDGRAAESAVRKEDDVQAA
jgi:hypothetical protein